MKRIFAFFLCLILLFPAGCGKDAEPDAPDAGDVGGLGTAREDRGRQTCLSLPGGIVGRHLHLCLRRSRKLVFIYFPLLKSFDIILKQLNNKCSHSFTYQFL